MRKVDITGQRFGKLFVIKEAGKTKHGAITWLCKCDCGNEKVISGNVLRMGDSKSCGCNDNRLRIAGKKFNRLTVIEEAQERAKNGKVRWKCICDCGNEAIVSGDHLVNGNTKSCGKCYKIDLQVKKVGRLTVLKYSFNKNGSAYWLCKCECGNTINVRSNSLSMGKTNSCGCLQRERASDASTIHGLSKTKAYNVEKTQRYNARKKKQTPKYYDVDTAQKLYQLRDILSRDLGQEYEVDHIQPLSKGGEHRASNLQVVTKTQNRCKYTDETSTLKGITKADYIEHKDVFNIILNGKIEVGKDE